MDYASLPLIVFLKDGYFGRNEIVLCDLLQVESLKFSLFLNLSILQKNKLLRDHSCFVVFCRVDFLIVDDQVRVSV